LSCDFSVLFVPQAAEQAEAFCYPSTQHNLIVFTLELPLLECIHDDRGAGALRETSDCTHGTLQNACAYSTA
jgi:hypothetical protein